MKNNVIPLITMKSRTTGTEYDLSKMIDNIVWSGDKSQAARCLEFDLIYPINDKYAVKTTVVPQVGDYIYFKVNINNTTKELFEGIVWERDLTESSEYLKVICYDNAKRIANSTLSYNLKSIKPEDTAKKVCSDLGVQSGSFQTTEVVYSDCALGKSGFDIIMAGYTKAMQSNGKKYILRSEKGKVNVFEKGVNTINIELDSTKNVTSAQFNETLESVINKVVIYDESGNTKDVVLNQGWIDAYGIIQDSISYQENEDNIKLANKRLKGPEKTASIDSLGEITAITGNAVIVKVPHSTLKGLFYIDSDEHTFKNEVYQMKLNIAFENMMHEVDTQKEATTDSSLSGSNGHTSNCPANGISHSDSDKDWGHGVTAERLNAVFGGKLSGCGKTFVQISNIFKVNPALMAAIAMHETGNGTSNAIKTKNNCFGMMSGSTVRTYTTLTEGIRAGISNLSRNYIYQGRKSIDAIQKKYAPVGASNDPTGLNKNWQNGVNKFYKNITGSTYNSSMSGTGVKTDIVVLSSACTCGGAEGYGSGSSSLKFMWPCDSRRITSRFGYRQSPGGVGSTNHKGLDIGAKVSGVSGDKIYASDGGTVTFVGTSGSYGNLIKISHKDGYETRYAHLKSFNVIKGAKVNKGQVIGYMGNTGASTGVHLHFEIRKNGTSYNPENYIK
jgi:murein DD-endopeptidase MepM/ murein hydrolase activator NlpD